MQSADLLLFFSGQVKSKIKFSPGGERKSADKILAEVKSKIELREKGKLAKYMMCKFANIVGDGEKSLGLFEAVKNALFSLVWAISGHG
jgi:hypothetical protein